MSEKRFELTKINPTVNPFDTVYFIIDYENPSKNIRNLKDCVECLNKQQDKILELEEELEKSSAFIIEQRKENKTLKEENEQLKHWKKRIIEYLSDWFNKTEYLSVLNKITEINNEIGLDSDE